MENSREFIEQQVLAQLAPELRDEAWRRCEVALARGYDGFGLWTYEDEPNLDDLVAVNPATGFVEFLDEGGPRAISEGTIWDEGGWLDQVKRAAKELDERLGLNNERYNFTQ